MKIILIVAICIYLVFFSLAIRKYKYITFADIDLDQNKILTPSEISYILDSRIRYKFYTNDINYVHSDVLPNKKNIKKYKKIILEIFSLKDGLPIKEITIDVFPRSNGN